MPTPSLYRKLSSLPCGTPPVNNISQKHPASFPLNHSNRCIIGVRCQAVVYVLRPAERRWSPKYEKLKNKLISTLRLRSSLFGIFLSRGREIPADAAKH